MHILVKRLQSKIKLPVFSENRSVRNSSTQGRSLGLFKIWKIFKIRSFRIFSYYMDPKNKFCEKLFFKNRIILPCAERLKFLTKISRNSANPRMQTLRLS